MFFTSCQGLLSRIIFNIASDWIELGGVVGSTTTADSTMVEGLGQEFLALQVWLPTWNMSAYKPHIFMSLLAQPLISYIFSWGTELVSAFGTTNFTKSTFTDVKLIFILVFFVVETFFVREKCRSLAISMLYTSVTSPLCLRVSFPISQ